MTQIQNPYYSRPIDVHRASDHPEIRSVIDTIWTSYFEVFDRPRRSGPKPQISYKQQLSIVILDLFVAWKTDPELNIGVPMSSNGWNTSSRYNALRLSRRIIPLVRRAHEVGLIDLANGSYSGPYGPANRNTRIRAAAPLQQLFSETSVDISDVTRHPDQECIVLKDDDRTQLEYEDTAETEAMRARLRTYNDFLLRTFIDIPTLEQPFIDRPITAGPDAGQIDRIPITSNRKFVRRVFSRGSWKLNGRFYGPWWQQIGEDLRSQIFIDDQPTVEIDFKGLHVNLLSLEQGVVIEGDPYDLPGPLFSEVPYHLQRDLVKKLVLKGINAPSKASAFSSFREDFPTGHGAKKLTNKQLTELLDLFFEKYPHLERKLCADQGIRLMYVDSCITDQVLTVATNLGIPVLGIHDSFIAAREHKDTLTEIMNVATREIIGTRLKVETTDMNRNFNRCNGYLNRLTQHRSKYT